MWNPFGQLAQAGDEIMVVNAKVLQDPHLPELVQFHVDEAVPGAPTVKAHPNDPLVHGGPIDVPRDAIAGILSRSASPAPSPSGQQPGTSSPVELGDPLALHAGRRYYAIVVLSGMEATFANPARVATAFADLGFTGVVASKTAPAGFPAAGPSGAWYVTGSRSGSDASVPRSAAPQVQRAWEA